MNMPEMDKDNDYLFNRLEAYMVFIEEELKFIEKHPIHKRKKFLEAFMVFFDNYLDVRNRMKDDATIFPESLHNKIVSNMNKIRKLAYEQDDYLFEITENVERFIDGLTEILYMAASIGGKITGIELDEDVKNTLTKKSISFLADLARTIAQYEKDYSTEVPKHISEQIATIKRILKKDFKIVVDEQDDLGPVEIHTIDSDMLLDMHEKISKMRKGKKKDEEQKKLNRMHEIYNK
jgi:hypothetical protein